MPRHRLAILLLLCLTPAAAAQTRVELKVNTYETTVNEPITATLSISQFNKCGEPKWGPTNDFAFELLGGPSVSNSTLIINGVARSERSQSYQFEITPNKPGQLTVPELTVEVDGETFKTNPIQVRVKEAEKDPPVTAEITCDAQTAYIGQLVNFKLVIEIRASVVQRQTTSASFMYSMLDRRGHGFGPFPPIKDESQVEPFTRELSDGNKVPYYRFTSELPWVIDRSGNELFSDIVIACFYPTAFGRDAFGSLEVTRQRNLRIKPVIKIPPALPLPTDKQPHGFTGAVGRFRIVASANPRKVRVGDPIELTLDVSGSGPMATLAAPDLSAQDALNNSFRVPTEALAGATVGDHRRFTQTIRAKRADVSEVPPIEYPYFDPQTGTYALARSNPVPLMVTAGEQLAASDVNVAAPKDESARGVEAIDGLRGNQTNPDRLLATTWNVTLPKLAVVLTAPPALVLGWFGYGAFVRTRGRDPKKRRRQMALSNALRRLDAVATSTAPAGEIEAAIANYFADRLGEPPARFVGNAAIELLRAHNAPPDVQEQLAALLRQCDEAAYAGSSQSAAESLLQQARACLTRLDREAI